MPLLANLLIGVGVMGAICWRRDGRLGRRLRSYPLYLACGFSPLGKLLLHPRQRFRHGVRLHGNRRGIVVLGGGIGS
jgi:hypothetical protein